MSTQNTLKKSPMHPADIQAALKKNEVTQRQLSRDLGVSEATINSVIYGITTSRRIAEYIAKITNLDIETIWPGRYKQDEAA